jgi:hypothetical protein
MYPNEVDQDLQDRWTTCWKCSAAINWGWADRCNRCWWAICKKCGACRRPMATSKYGRRGPCPREIPLFAFTLSLRWARDHLNNRIDWAAFGQKGPTLVTPNADPEAEWLSRLRRDFRLPTLTITTRGLNGKYGARIHIPTFWDLLDNPRAVELVALALEHQAEKGVLLDVGEDRLSARIGGGAYARIGGEVYESYCDVTWPVLDDLEDHGQGWREVMTPSA